MPYPSSALDRVTGLRIADLHPLPMACRSIRPGAGEVQVTQCIACNAVGRIDSAIPSPSTVGGLATHRASENAMRAVQLARIWPAQNRPRIVDQSGSEVCQFSSVTRGTFLGRRPLVPPAQGIALGHHTPTPSVSRPNGPTDSAGRQLACPAAKDYDHRLHDPDIVQPDPARKERTVSQSLSRIWLHIVFEGRTVGPLGRPRLYCDMVPQGVALVDAHISVLT